MRGQPLSLAQILSLHQQMVDKGTQIERINQEITNAAAEIATRRAQPGTACQQPAPPAMTSPMVPPAPPAVTIPGASMNGRLVDPIPHAPATLALTPRAPAVAPCALDLFGLAPHQPLASEPSHAAALPLPPASGMAPNTSGAGGVSEAGESVRYALRGHLPERRSARAARQSAASARPGAATACAPASSPRGIRSGRLNARSGPDARGPDTRGVESVVRGAGGGRGQSAALAVGRRAAAAERRHECVEARRHTRSAHRPPCEGAAEGHAVEGGAASRQWFDEARCEDADGGGAGTRAAEGGSDPRPTPGGQLDDGGDDDEEFCSACGDGDADDDDPILLCDGCNVAVHRTCYRLTAVPDGDWFCDVCVASRARSSAERQRAEHVCCPVCPQRAGAFVRTYEANPANASSPWAHVRWAAAPPRCRSCQTPPPLLAAHGSGMRWGTWASHPPLLLPRGSCTFFHVGPGFLPGGARKVDGFERINERCEEEPSLPHL